MAAVLLLAVAAALLQARRNAIPSIFTRLIIGLAGILIAVAGLVSLNGPHQAWRDNLRAYAVRLSAWYYTTEISAVLTIVVGVVLALAVVVMSLRRRLVQN